MIKEINKEDIMPFQSLQSQIGIIFDGFRNDKISSDDYHVLLFLLSAYKDNLFSIELVNDNSHTKERLIEQLRNSNNDLKSQGYKIFQIFEPTIQRLSENAIKQFFTFFGYLNKQVLIDNFSEIFDGLLYRILKSQGRYGAEFVQPVELTRFIFGLADLNKSTKLFNPFAGLASFGVYLDKGQEYSGQEQNQKTWALGALRLMAYGRPVSLNYVCDDSILNWPAPNEKFDLIISNPPMGMRIGNQFGVIGSNYRTVEHFLIEKGIHSLTQDGKLIALLPQGFLFRGMQDERLRKQLIEEDLIDTIISLPGGLLSNTGMSLIILLLNKNKKLPGKVKFVDAKSFVIVKGSREKILNDISLISTVKSNNEYEDVVKIVSNEQILENNYNLSVPRYFKRQIEGVKLCDILEIVRGQRDNFPKTGKLIRIRDLKDDKIDCQLDFSSLEESVLSRPDIQLIAESCLLIAMRWRSLKPTLFEFKGNTIFKSQDILSFKINESIVDKAYLINELHSDYVQEQLESFRLGNSIIPFLRRHDLMEVVIKLPSLKEQRAKMQGIYELSDKIKMLNAERNALTHGVGVKLYESVSTIKHSLGKPLLNIGSSLRNIGNALSRFSSDWELIKLNERYDLTIKDSFDSIFNNLSAILLTCSRFIPKALA
jgi:type I restriction enzyme M protein